MTSRRVTVLVADDHPFIRAGVRALISAQRGIHLVGEAADGVDALRLVETLHPDVVVLDLVMPRLSGLDTLRDLFARGRHVNTVLLTATVDSHDVLEALQLGVRGVVLKDAVADELIRAIKTIVNGQYWLGGTSVTNLVPVLRRLTADTTADASARFALSARERETTALVVEGLTNRDIAAALGISEDTVKRHITNIFNKTGMSSRLELAMLAVRHRLVTGQQPRSHPTTHES